MTHGTWQRSTASNIKAKNKHMFYCPNTVQACRILADFVRSEGAVGQRRRTALLPAPPQVLRLRDMPGNR